MTWYEAPLGWSQEAWDDLADWQRYGWRTYGRIRPRTYEEARRWFDEFEASLSPQQKLRREKETEAWVSAIGDRILGPLREALGLADDDV
jgi:hypothetical protein